MKKWIGWVLLALSLYVTYQGWRNSQPTADTEAMSRSTACSGTECTVEGDGPQKVRTDFMSRTYEWRTSTGPVSVACQRAYIFAGHWGCKTAP